MISPDTPTGFFIPEEELEVSAEQRERNRALYDELWEELHKQEPARAEQFLRKTVQRARRETWLQHALGTELHLGAELPRSFWISAVAAGLLIVPLLVYFFVWFALQSE